MKKAAIARPLALYSSVEKALVMLVMKKKVRTENVHVKLELSELLMF